MTTPHPVTWSPSTDEETQTADVLMCEAGSIEVDNQDGIDPFDATFLMFGTHQSGTPLGMWLRLTPTTITRLTTQLQDVLHAQLQVLSGERQPHTGGTVEDVGDDNQDADAGLVDSRVKRLFDPMGIRHLKNRSPHTTMVLAAAIAALVLVAFIVQLVRA